MGKKREKKSPTPKRKSALSTEMQQQLEQELEILFGGAFPEKLKSKGGQIKKLRQFVFRDPITQEALAGRAGLDLDQGTIAKYEKEGALVPTLHMFAIAKALQVNLHAVAFFPQPPITDPLGRVDFFEYSIKESWILGTLPRDPKIDFKVFLREQLDHPLFDYQFNLSAVEQRLLWWNLQDQGWVIIHEDGKVTFNSVPQIPPFFQAFNRVISHFSMCLVDIVENPRWSDTEIQCNLKELADYIHDRIGDFSGCDFLQACDILKSLDMKISKFDQTRNKITILLHQDLRAVVERTCAYIKITEGKYTQKGVLGVPFAAAFLQRSESAEFIRRAIEKGYEDQLVLNELERLFKEAVEVMYEGRKTYEPFILDVIKQANKENETR